MSALSRGLLRTEASMGGWPSSLELRSVVVGALASSAPAHDDSSRQERKGEADGNKER
jgi:hypothetical protein